MKTGLLIIFMLLFLQNSSASSNMTRSMISSNVTCIPRERESLLIFKQRVTDRFKRLSTWTGVECCGWQGVECDKQTGRVVKLDLRSPISTRDIPFLETPSIKEIVISNWLEGVLSPSLLYLNHLRYLDLSNNYFSGHIPEFLGSFKRLEYLNLSHSGFSGNIPHHLGNLSRLSYLDINADLVLYKEDSQAYFSQGHNILINDDLSWVSLLSSLKHLDLSAIVIGDHIDLFGAVSMLSSLLTLNLAHCGISNIPSVTLENFTSLNSLDLSWNHINSTIPIWLSNSTGLMHLDLGYNNFHGPIPDFLGKLSTLSFIGLSHNSFHTQMPNLFWNLSGLVYLDLSYNKFYGWIPPNDPFVEENMTGINGTVHGGFKKLEHLLLSWNELTGPVPPSLGGITSLRELDIRGNLLNGSIPTSFALLSRMENLNLGHNQLSGNIPMSLGQLSKLQTLDVNRNLLFGVLSEIHFTKLKNLILLDLSLNSLTLNLSSQWVPPFQLQGFYASSCNIGPGFPNWLQTQTNLESLYLSNSGIQDAIPEWFGNISSNIFQLDLSHNQISGKLPQFHDSSNSTLNRYLVMNSNKFEGSLTSLPESVVVLDLSHNLLSGRINPKHLCKLLKISVLDLSQNEFYGKLPRCLGNMSSLEVIDLSNNNITGVIPSSLSSLEYLLSLHLQNNRLHGYIPISLQNLTWLNTMDLSNNLFLGSIPFWIGEKLSSLRFLNLESNKFTGRIPLQLCKLNALQYLNLAQNNISGTIPPCFGTLIGMMGEDIGFGGIANYDENIMAYIKGSELWYTKTLNFLTSLDLSSNQIIGEIPYALMNLVGLKNLNLSRNLLDGQIPSNIGDLKQLESLDLSMNKLSGRIPQSLTSLHFLSFLSLAFNNLSGAVPVGSQIQTLGDPSVIYEGNNGLCGLPAFGSCDGINNSLYNNVVKSEAQDNTEFIWFYSGAGLGFAVGYLGLLCSLYFFETWRLAYFEFLGSVYGWLMTSILLSLASLRTKFVN